MVRTIKATAGPTFEEFLTAIHEDRATSRLQPPPEAVDCPDLLAFLDDPDFKTFLGRVAYKEAKGFRPVEGQDLAAAVWNELWKDGKRHELQRLWAGKSDLDARRIINGKNGDVRKLARRLKWDLRAAAMPVNLNETGLTVKELAAALKWIPTAGYSFEIHDRPEGARRDHEAHWSVYDYAAVDMIRSWPAEKQRLFRLAWVEQRPWAEVAAAFPGTSQAAIKRKAARARLHALNARKSEYVPEIFSQSGYYAKRRA